MIARALALALAALALGAMAAPASADAAFGLEDFDVAFTGPPPEGSLPGDLGAPLTTAGAHPYQAVVSMKFFSQPTGEGGETADEPAKDVFIDLIEGLAGSPTAVPFCSAAAFLTLTKIPVPPELGGGFASVSGCQDAAALGIAAITLASKISAPPPSYGAVYNLKPPPGVAAKLGFWILGVPVTAEVGVEPTHPYRIRGGATNLSQALEVIAAKLVLWGNPADPDHDPLRGQCLDPINGGSYGICKAPITEVPFLTLPRACRGPLEVNYRADSWIAPGVFVQGGAISTEIEECGALGFAPEIDVAPTSTAAESASGLEVAIDIDDEGMDNAKGTAAADIEALELAFPPGMTLNPSAAEGLGVCTPAQFAAATLENPGCPAASKLGEIEADTPLFENHTFHGALYLAQPDDPGTPGKENPFDSLAALYIVIRDPELGVFLTLATETETDPVSGQILATTEDIPPYPLERVRISLRKGPRAPFVTPPLCGTYATTATMRPSSGEEPLEKDLEFEISEGPGGSPCPAAGTPPFAPGFEAGTASNAAGRYSPFSMRLTRADGEQDLTRFSATLPPGVTGKIAGVFSCADSQIAAAKQKTGRQELASPSCPAASRIGHVVTAAGVGTALTYVEGSLYLAGPFNGAPLSVAAIVPGVAGPFDVGTVVTRVALRLNPQTAQVEIDGAASDPIPHILKGIPLKVRDIRVYADRPDFTLNPTSCEESATLATIFGSGADPFLSSDDSSVADSSRFQAASCASLGFKPKLILRLKGATKRTRNPALQAELKSRSGDANVKGAIVTLPPSQFIDNAHIANPCTRVQFAEGACPKSSVLGHARAFTPLLDYPLQGPVYFRSNGGERLLPDVVADLGGAPGQFRFTLVVAILRSKNARVRTKVLNAPDAPVTRFVLNMAGGKKGLLENSESLCAKPQRANLNLIGQNGRRYKTSPKVKTPSCEKGKRKRGS